MAGFAALVRKADASRARVQAAPRPMFGRPPPGSAGCACGASRAPAALSRPSHPVLGGLVVSMPADPEEREADAVADRIARGDTVQATKLGGGSGESGGTVLARQCDSCAAAKDGQQEQEDEGTGTDSAAISRSPERGVSAPSSSAAAVAPEPAGIAATLAGTGGGAGFPLPARVRSAMERPLGADLSAVRVHADGRAAELSRALHAQAFTHRNHIFFGAGRFAPGTTEGRRLIAHELAHVVQQGRGRGTGTLQRACISGAACVSPPGSASGFGTAVQSREAAARAARAARPLAAQRAGGHTGRARQLEIFLDSQAPGLRASVHGIFVDRDMDPDVAASVQSCSSMVPPIAGAAKPCVFVPAVLNQQAATFNASPGAATIGGQPREDWRIGTVQTLGHEIQHVRFDTTVSPRPAPAGVASCARADVDHELSELNAIISEFPVVFRAVPAGAAPGHPAALRLQSWFTHAITNPGESIRGILTVVRCKCSCADTDAFVKETVDFVTSSWTAPEKAAFHGELRKPVWALGWPV
jgi:hypothetical protein